VVATPAWSWSRNTTALITGLRVSTEATAASRI
jgi:hypothetical protein